MIDRPHFNGPISFQCDKCPEVAETHCEEFSGAHAKIKARGWTTRKIGDDWLHFCPDCSQPSIR